MQVMSMIIMSDNVDLQMVENNITESTGVAEGAQTWGGGALLNFYLQSSLGGASRHLARTRS